MDNEKPDDFMCIMTANGKSIATHKGVTVVASRRPKKTKCEARREASPISWWRKLIGRFK